MFIPKYIKIHENYKHTRIWNDIALLKTNLIEFTGG